MGQGLFISFEGGEGAGKGTQIRHLNDRLIALGRTPLCTRDPGGTPESERIRNLLVQRDGGDWVPHTEVFLFFAARVQMTETLIRPALGNGQIVIADRYADSTMAYQAYGREMGRTYIEQVEAAALGGLKPDLTFILDLPPQIGLARSARAMSTSTDARRQTEDRFERLATDFHERVRSGYLDIAAREPERCHVIDATQTVDKVSEDVWKIVGQKVKSS